MEIILINYNSIFRLTKFQISMKKILNLAFIAMLALGAASCSKDVDLDGGNKYGGNTSTLAFNFEGLNSGVTPYSYAAENFEKAVSDATVYIFEYKADQSGALLQVESRDFTQAANDYLVVVDNISALANKKLVAYFAINNGATFDALADLTAYTAGSGKTEADFLAEETDVIAGKVGRTNFLMTAGYTPSGGFDPHGEYPVTVVRRVARFDIVNQSPSAIVSVDKVTVKGAADRGNVVGLATTAAAAGTIAADVVYDLAASEYGADGASALVWEEEKDAEQVVISKTAKSVFYLNPTTLDKAGSETVLYIEATVGTEKKVFELQLTADVDVKANTRYLLTLTPDLRFRITVADWEWNENENTINTQPLNTKLGIVPGSLALDAGMSRNLPNVITVPATGGQITFGVTASSAQGTSYSLYGDGNLADHTGLVQVAEVPSSTVTYGAPYFASNYTVTVPDLSAEQASFTTIKIADKANPGNTFNIYINYAAGTDQALAVNEATFPDALFRGYVESKLGLTGVVTLTELDAIDRVEVWEGVVGTSNRQKVKSVAGIEFFPNLTYLNIAECGVTSVDLSANTLLTNFYAKLAYLEVLDLSNNPNLVIAHCYEAPNLHSVILKGTYSALTYLNFRNSKVSSIDASNCPALERFNAQWTNLKSVDVSNCPMLWDLEVNHTAIRSLNVSNNPALKNLYTGYTNINAIDISNNPDLEILSIGTTGLSSLDISNNLKLRELVIGYTKIPTAPDISKHTLLERVNFDGTSITDFDFSHLIGLKRLIVNTETVNLNLSNHPALTELIVADYVPPVLDQYGVPTDVLDPDGRRTPSAKNCKLASLDISNNPLLTTLLLVNCPNINQVAVWPGFVDAATQFTVDYRIAGTTPSPMAFVK